MNTTWIKDDTDRVTDAGTSQLCTLPAPNYKIIASTYTLIQQPDPAQGTYQSTYLSIAI